MCRKKETHKQIESERIKGHIRTRSAGSSSVKLHRCYRHLAPLKVHWKVFIFSSRKLIMTINFNAAHAKFPFLDIFRALIK